MTIFCNFLHVMQLGFTWRHLVPFLLIISDIVPVGEDLLEDKYSGISANLASYVEYDFV